MAKKQKKTKKKFVGFKNLFEAFAFLKDERFKVVLGGVLLFFALYLTIAFVSYFFTWKTDNIQWIEVFSSSETVVDNWAGKVGAAFANKFITDWFGLSSFGFVFMAFVIGIRLFKLRLLPLRKSLRYALISIIWLSLALGFFDFINQNSVFLLGGAHGFFISKWLIAFVGEIGTAFILLIILSAFLIFAIENSLLRIKMFFLSIFSGKPEEIEDEVIDDSSQTNDSKNLKDRAAGIFDEDNEDDEKSDSDISNLSTENNESDSVPEEKEEEGETDSVELSIDNNIEKQEKREKVEKGDLALELNVQEGEEDIEDEDDDDVEFEVDDSVEDDSVDEISKEPQGDYDPTLDLSFYSKPDPELLEEHDFGNERPSQEELEENKNQIVNTLRNYKIEIDRISATIGPTVTLYEIVPAPGVRISKIQNLEKDIALSLAALGIRIIAPMPGRGTIGIEVPNKKPEIVSMKSVILSKKFQESKYELPLALGKNISNETFVIDLAKTPHMLVAGATGQGKSVGINAILTSLLFSKHPSQVKFVLIDPKKVELSVYNMIEKHFLAKLPDEEEPIITDVTKVVSVLNSLCIEMDDRYDLLKQAGARNIKEYNAKFVKRRLNPDKGHRFMPYIVVIIDEFADLIMTAGKDVEMPIARIAQLARAIGIHAIVATQRPSTNIITGIIKANFPTRVAFKVTSMIDSRTILDSPGANQLIGRGDMLISQGSDMVRVQCAFVDTPEVERIVAHIYEQQGYPSALLLPEYSGGDDEDGGVGDVDLSKRDDLFDDAARIVVIHQQGSTSLIQRKLSIGYNRAGRIIDQLEAAGIVGPFEGSKARQVNYPDEVSLEQYLQTLG